MSSSKAAPKGTQKLASKPVAPNPAVKPPKPHSAPKLNPPTKSTVSPSTEKTASKTVASTSSDKPAQKSLQKLPSKSTLSKSTVTSATKPSPVNSVVKPAVKGTKQAPLANSASKTITSSATSSVVIKSTSETTKTEKATADNWPLKGISRTEFTERVKEYLKNAKKNRSRRARKWI